MSRAQPTARSPWRLVLRAVLWQAAALVCGLAVAIVLGTLAAGPGSAADAPSRHGPPIPSALVAGELAGELVLLLVSWRYALQIGNGAWPAGVGDRAIRRPFLLIALLCALPLVWAAGYVALIHSGIARPLPVHPAGPPYSQLRIVQAVLFGVVAPLCEEYFFRGWLWTGLRRFWSAGWTGAATSLLFVLAHGGDGWGKLVLMVPVAALLAAARHYCDSVRASIAIHAANNALPSVILVAVA